MEGFIVESDHELENPKTVKGVNQDRPIQMSLESMPLRSYFKIYLEFLLQLQVQNAGQIMLEFQPGTIYYEAAKKIEGKLCDVM